MKKITTKLALFFIAIVCISSILSFFAATLFSYNIQKEIKMNQEEIASTIFALYEKTDMSIDEIITLTSTSMYDVQKIDDIEPLNLDADELDRLQRLQPVFKSHNRLQGTATILRLDNTYIKISLHPHNTILKIVASRVWLNLLSYVIIGALLITLLVRIVVRPILKLTKATQEVAQGNFDIEVEYKSDDEIGQLTDNFNKMTRELKNIEILRKDFIANVSHEIKTPIGSIQGFAKLLQKDNLTEEDKREYTNIIIEETARLSNLASSILKLSKLENQEILEKKNIFSLDEQIRRCILLLEHKWSRKNIDFDLKLAKVDFQGNEELLQQVWLNLLGNAIKFSNPGGTITVTLRKTSSQVEVTISDTGIGMDQKTKERIFEKFYQGDRTHSHEGTGLGLSLAKRIIDLHRGSIHVESALHKGSTFTVQLPLHP